MKIKDLLPERYNQNMTMQAIANAEQVEVDNLKAEIKQAFDNNFVSTSNIAGIQNYERILKITADPSVESLEFRRLRIINKLGTFTSYTWLFLIDFLNNILGRENYRLVLIEFDLMLRLSEDLLYFTDEIRTYLQEIIPANINLEIKQLQAVWGDYLDKGIRWSEPLNSNTIWIDMKVYRWGD